MMTRNELISAITDYQEMKRMKEEAEAAMQARADEIKAHMTEAGLDTLSEGPYKVTWKYSSPQTVPDVEKMKAAGIFDAFSKQNKPARPFRVT